MRKILEKNGVAGVDNHLNIKKMLKSTTELENKVICIEELSELQKEITKDLRGKLRREHLIEELADCHIVLQMVKELYNIKDNELFEMYDKKMERNISRIKDITTEGDTDGDKYLNCDNINRIWKEIENVKSGIKSKLTTEESIKPNYQLILVSNIEDCIYDLLLSKDISFEKLEKLEDDFSELSFEDIFEAFEHYPEEETILKKNVLKTLIDVCENLHKCQK